ncbi:MAG: hypothetical protein ACJ8FY_01380 [Gemmataceae bacterium]
MFNSLFDARLTVYMLLVGVAFLLLFAWWQTRKKRYLKALLPVLGLALIYSLIGHFVETPQQQITRKLREMADGVTHNDLDKVLAHISEDFHVGSTNKRAFRTKAHELMSGFGVTKMVVWDIDVVNLDKEKGTAQVNLAIKTFGDFRGSGDLFYNGRALFQRDPDGQWRLQSFQIFHPFIDTQTPLPLPL